MTEYLPVLVFGRVLQGVSFALFPIGVAVLRGRLGPRRLVNAIGLMSGILAVGGGLGMVAAGVMHSEPAGSGSPDSRCWRWPTPGCGRWWWRSS
ncbi:hypothetical protein [Rhodococcus jostii]|uniref:hypothetical protein n=1 Tax=Rhodococcus jostii TaxID=132919 RepID=UPI0030846541